MAPLYLAGIASLVSVACQGYTPDPLDESKHRAAWHERKLQDALIEPFLQRAQARLGDAKATVDLMDGVDLHEARWVALVFNPDLRLARARAGVAQVRSENTGLWADPSFSANVLRITDDVPDPWLISPGLGFQLPLSGRLGVEQDRGSAQARAALATVVEAEWSVWNRVANTWIEWTATRLRLRETERFLASLDEFAPKAHVLAERGELPRTEANLFILEQVRLRSLLPRLQAETLAGEQRLRALMGLSPEAAVNFRPAWPEPRNDQLQAAHQAAYDTLADRNPTLARLRLDYEVAEQSLKLEIRKQFPDLQLGPILESEQGQTRIGLFGGFSLPIFNANRAAIATAQANRGLARASFETAYERLCGRWSTAQARARGLSEQRLAVEQSLVPLVDHQLVTASKLLQLGEGDFLTLFEYLTRAHQIKLDWIETRRDEAWTRFELDFLLGPPNAVTPHVSRENDA